MGDSERIQLGNLTATASAFASTDPTDEAITSVFAVNWELSPKTLPLTVLLFTVNAF